MNAPPPSVIRPAGSFQNKRKIKVYGTTLLAKSILRMSDFGVSGRMMLAPPADIFCVKPTSAGPTGEKHELHGVARILVQIENRGNRGSRRLSPELSFASANRFRNRAVSSIDVWWRSYAFRTSSVSNSRTSITNVLTKTRAVRPSALISHTYSPKHGMQPTVCPNFHVENWRIRARSGKPRTKSDVHSSVSVPHQHTLR